MMRMDLNHMRVMKTHIYTGSKHYPKNVYQKQSGYKTYCILMPDINGLLAKAQIHNHGNTSQVDK